MEKCCERDYDNDGNCDRHPMRKLDIYKDIPEDATDAERADVDARRRQALEEYFTKQSKPKSLQEQVDELAKVLSEPEVQNAIALLTVKGLLAIPRTARVFCAYCGADICEEPVIHANNRRVQSLWVIEQVAKHRSTCAEYQAQLSDAKGEAVFNDRD